MTRQEVIEFLNSLGIENPSKETIDDFMNKHNADVQREKSLAEKYKGDALKVKELQEQLDRLNNQNLSELEVANKNVESANAKIAELEKTIKASETRRQLAELGIVGESADRFFTEDGSVDFGNLASILTNVKTMAISQKEKELLDGTPNPSGSNNNDGQKTDIDIMAEKAGKEMAFVNQSSSDILANYIK